MNRNTFCALLLALMAAGLPASRAVAGTSLYSFNQDCQALSSQQSGQNAEAAKLIIQSWLREVSAQTVSNPGHGVASDPLKTVFKDAENPAWCAASIGKFVKENQGSLPDRMTAADILPLWWMSVHPDAQPQHRELLQNRLKELKQSRIQERPVRRFPA